MIWIEGKSTAWTYLTELELIIPFHPKEEEEEEKPPVGRPAPDEIEKKAAAFKDARFGHEDFASARLSQVATEIIDWVGGPLDLDTLVKVVTYLLQAKEPRLESLNPPSDDYYEQFPATQSFATESYGESKELLTLLWAVVRNLPREQRDVFSFGFEDDLGRDLFTVLLSAGVVTLTQLTRETHRSAEEILELMQRMPMDTATLANELQTNRGNIYKWRFRALQQLRHELSGDSSKNRM